MMRFKWIKGWYTTWPLSVDGLMDLSPLYAANHRGPVSICLPVSTPIQRIVVL